MAGELEPGWNAEIGEELSKPYMVELKKFLVQEKESGAVVYPKNKEIFNAFNITPFDKVKVVIIGQDPYHGPNQAHGLSFSVRDGIAVPPSLKNIYKELSTDIPGFKTPQTGDLTKWAEQGVLLLNATLTVRAATAGSHQKKGWEKFTDAAIKKLANDRTGLVFILWGAYAQSKSVLINPDNNHLIIKSTHPSPLAVSHGGFFGSRPFSKTNEFLIQQGKEPIDWQI
jgi:uracil-DNA glycosylase